PGVRGSHRGTGRGAGDGEQRDAAARARGDGAAERPRLPAALGVGAGRAARAGRAAHATGATGVATRGLRREAAPPMGTAGLASWLGCASLRAVARRPTRATNSVGNRMNRLEQKFSTAARDGRAAR